MGIMNPITSIDVSQVCFCIATEQNVSLCCNFTAVQVEFSIFTTVRLRQAQGQAQKALGEGEENSMVRLTRPFLDTMKMPETQLEMFANLLK